MSALALVWRLARRGTVLTRAQAVLIAALIALPMLGYSGVALVIDSRSATTAEALDAALGHTRSRAQLVNAPDSSMRQTPPGSQSWQVDEDSDGTPLHQNPDASNAPITSALPAGTRVLRLADTTVEADSKAGVADLAATVGPAWDHSLRGRFTVTSGRAPANDHELMVTPAALTRLDTRVGDAVHLNSPITGDYTITGLIDDTRVARSVPELFLRDGALDGTAAVPAAGSYSYYLPDLDVDATQAKTLNHAGYIVLSRSLAARYGLDWPNTIQSSNGSLWLMLGLALAFGAFEVILLAGSAFFIGAKQRQRVLAIVASAGGSRGTLIGIVSLTGAALGLVAGFVGSAAGVGAGSLYLRLTADGSASHYPGYHLIWWVHALMVLAAALIGFSAAMIPAVAVARMDVVSSLRGATRPGRASRRRPVLGVIVTLAGAALALGCGVTAAIITSGDFHTSDGHALLEQHASRVLAALYYGITAGVIVMQFGLIMMSSLVLAGIGSAARRLGVAPRLASRDLARNRSRAVPAIAAIMTTSFLAVFVMGTLASTDAADRSRYQWDIGDQQAVAYVAGAAPQSEGLGAHADELAAALERTLAVTRPVLISSAPEPARSGETAETGLYAVPLAAAADRCPETVQGYVASDSGSKDWRCNDLVASYGQSFDDAPLLVVGGPRELAQILGHTPSKAAVAALRGGGAVSLHRAFVHDGQLTIGWYSAQKRDELMKVSVLAAPAKSAAVPAVYERTAHPLGFGAILSPGAAQRLGIDAVPTTLLATLKSSPTQAQQDALRAAVDVINASNNDAFGAGVQTGPSSTSPAYLWAALAASSLIALAAAVVALSLARQDGARDGAAFEAIGAPPRTRRTIAFWQALIIVGSGAVLGALTATLTVYAAFGLAPGQIFAMPWTQVALGTVGLAATIAIGSWVVSGRPTADKTRRAAIA